MKKILLFVFLTTLLAYGGNTAPLFKITFDNATIGPAPNYYIIGPGEIIPTQCTAIWKMDNLNIDTTEPNTEPEIVDANIIGLGAPFQGGKALRVHSPGRDEGYHILFTPAFPPGSLTVEYIFCLNTADIGTKNVASLQYLGSTEWPFGQTFQWMLRIHGASSGGTNRLSFWTDKGDSNGMYVNSINPVPTKQWTHVAAVLNYNNSNPATSTILLYLNGVLQGSTTYNATGNSFSLGCSSDIGHFFSIGFNAANRANFADHRGMDGYIDAVAISTTALGPGTFVLSTASLQLTLSAETILRPIGSSAGISATGGLKPYSWSFSTTASVDSVAIGYINTTSGDNVTFYATGAGEAPLFCIDSDTPAKIKSVYLIVVPTKAPLFPESELKSTVREIPTRVPLQGQRGWELFE
ncbi:MAG: LamG domain-containing protein [bacterium]|nr:LamG domain-containing protein [bacterium]